MGVTANTSWCGEEVFDRTETGELIVDQYLETNINGIFSAGDACHVRLDDVDADNAWFQMKLWSQSQTMGWIAAHSMTAQSEEDKEEDLALQFNFELFGHITTFFGKKCVFLGKYNLKKDEHENIDILMRVKPNEEFIKLIHVLL